MGLCRNAEPYPPPPSSNNPVTCLPPKGRSVLFYFDSFSKLCVSTCCTNSRKKKYFWQLTMLISKVFFESQNIIEIECLCIEDEFQRISCITNFNFPPTPGNVKFIQTFGVSSFRGDNRHRPWESKQNRIRHRTSGVGINNFLLVGIRIRIS